MRTLAENKKVYCKGKLCPEKFKAQKMNCDKNRKLEIGPLQLKFEIKIQCDLVFFLLFQFSFSCLVSYNCNCTLTLYFLSTSKVLNVPENITK